MSETSASTLATTPVVFPKNPWVKKSVLPGFGLSLGLAALYASLIVFIPLAGLVIKSLELSWPELWAVVSNARALASYKLTFGAAFVAASLNLLFGFIVAWVLVRYQFFGKRVVDALVDLPFALPTAVAGIALTALYTTKGWVGQWFWLVDIKIAYTWIGVTVALTFIGLPFVVRTVQPVLADLEAEIEEAAASLGASRWQTFKRILLPALLPSLLTGFALAFARAIGEYGSVVFISGNMPYKTEITPLLIMTKLEEFDYAGAAALGTVMLIFSFVLLLLINLLQHWSHKRTGG
ncbi:sulfate ABC transporter permease subunit CysT [Cellvibrio sp. QJXJ]|jgi:sulfate transport system permease protein|uniref:sulfate ABC transporter permease subunit CysT n=1 Tax=Cellvibrio sp. QJXJ TaxID=2964606 RepID=UPI0021C40F2E|nr:sulfate ABC transporter permease subunit CysT [Cellvibrio sp. QJXJ]UUA72114.1 sulfate ABC transporter permease subunit CysT [Cellvibrio sp. QJXJ]